MPVVPAPHYQQTYSPADLQSLFAQFAIPAAQQTEVAQILEDAAAIWRWYECKIEDRIPASASKHALRNVSKAAGNLQAALEALPVPAVWALEHQLIEAEHGLLTEQDHATGKPVLSLLLDDGRQSRFIVDQTDYKHLINALVEMATTAQSAHFGGRRTKQDDALRMWISNMEQMWAQTLGRPFTRDMTADGTPISDAARFCVMAFRHVSARTPPHSILNAMKKRIYSVKTQSLANNTAKSGV